MTASKPPDVSTVIVSPELFASMTGLEYLQKMQRGELPGMPMAETLGLELAEEVGLRVDPEALEPLGVFTATAANEPGFAVVADVFRVDIGGQQPTPDAEIAELRWVTAATASGIEIAPLAREYFLPA